MEFMKEISMEEFEYEYNSYKIKVEKTYTGYKNLFVLLGFDNVSGLISSVHEAIVSLATGRRYCSTYRYSLYDNEYIYKVFEYVQTIFHRDLICILFDKLDYVLFYKVNSKFHYLYDEIKGIYNNTLFNIKIDHFMFHSDHNDLRKLANPNWTRNSTLENKVSESRREFFDKEISRLVSDNLLFNKNKFILLFNNTINTSNLFDNKASKKELIDYLIKSDCNTQERGPLSTIPVVASESVNIEFRNYTGNNSQFFDIIVVSVPMVRQGRNMKQQMEEVKKYKKYIDKEVLKRIKENKKFIKSGLPINVLKATNIVYTNQDYLQYTFEIKGNELPEE